jgi:hypothetical protein
MYLFAGDIRGFTANDFIGYACIRVVSKVFSRRFAPNLLLRDTSFLKFRKAKFQK